MTVMVSGPFAVSVPSTDGTLQQLTQPQVLARMSPATDAQLSAWEAGFPDNMTWDPSMVVDGGTVTINSVVHEVVALGVGYATS